MVEMRIAQHVLPMLSMLSLMSFDDREGRGELRLKRHGNYNQFRRYVYRDGTIYMAYGCFEEDCFRYDKYNKTCVLVRCVAYPLLIGCSSQTVAFSRLVDRPASHKRKLTIRKMNASTSFVLYSKEGKDQGGNGKPKPINLDPCKLAGASCPRDFSI